MKCANVNVWSAVLCGLLLSNVAVAQRALWPSSSGLQGVVEPPELSGPPATPVVVKDVYRDFLNSDATKADPSKPNTLQPALNTLNELITQAPDISDFYLLRAQVSCHLNRSPEAVIQDIDSSIKLHSTNDSSFKTVADHYALRAKVRFNAGDMLGALADLDRAAREDVRDAPEIFNNGQVKPDTPGTNCDWSQSDLERLATRFPADFRPRLYMGLRLLLFGRFHVEDSVAGILEEFHRASELNPKSPLPHYYIGNMYGLGVLGGMLSTKNAECLDWVKPRTRQCLELDPIHRTGVRELTTAIALDPHFQYAYYDRAETLIKIKEHQQAIRDFNKVIELGSGPDRLSRSALEDRAFAKIELGRYAGAIEDYTRAINMGCGEICTAYDNRARAYVKLHDYPKAMADVSVSIRRMLSHVVFLMNIDQFRRLYPEYDSVPDDVLCERVRSLFFPNMTYADFAKQFLIDAKDFKSTALPDLYLKRGDAYAAMREHARAEREYDRVERGFPDAAKYSFTMDNGKRVRSSEEP